MKLPLPDSASFVPDLVNAFEPGSDCELFAKKLGGPDTMHVKGYNTFLDYIFGYQEGMQRLYASYIARSDASLVFPIIFLFRHSVELSLKYLLRVVRFLLQRTETRRDKDREKCHHIEPLWCRLESLLLEAFPNESREDFRKAARLIRQLAAVDEGSMEFRYPRDLDGKLHLDSFCSFDLPKFMLHAEWLIRFFLAVGDAMRAEIEAREGISYSF